MTKPSKRITELYKEIRNLEKDTDNIRLKLANQSNDEEFYKTDGDFPGEYNAKQYVDALTKQLQANEILIDAARSEFLVELKKTKK